jgi:YHS domain-containing protein
MNTKHMLNRFIPFALFIILSACNNDGGTKPESTSVPAVSDSTPIESASATLNKRVALIDPVCKMELEAGSKDTVNYNSQLYTFCSEHCKNEFIKNPAEFVKK